ncbi:MAG: hypothetical protein WD794_17035 [Mycobacteriales bacterium]
MIAFLSAKGSPGTTTTALLAAALWPEPVLLVDADTEGGDVALRLRRADGAPVDRSRGLLSLLPLARREMQPATLPEHAQVLRGGVEAIAGLSAPGQAGAASHLWTNLADAFARTADRDVLVDCGRVSHQSVHLPLLQRADVVVCVLRPDVSGVVHARDRLAGLQPSLVGPDGHRPRVGLVLVAERPSGRDAEGAAGVLSRDLPGLDVFGRLAHDPAGAAVFEGFEVSRPERTLLVRSGRAMVDELVAAVRRERRGQGPALPHPEPGTDGQEATPAAPAPAGHAAPGRRAGSRGRSLLPRRTPTGAT